MAVVPTIEPLDLPFSTTDVLVPDRTPRLTITTDDVETPPPPVTGAVLNIFRTYGAAYSEGYDLSFQNPQLAVYLTAPEDHSITGNLKIELLNPAYTVAGETVEFYHYTGWYIEGSGVLGDGSVSSSYDSADSGIDDSAALNFIQQIFSTGAQVSLDAGSQLMLWVSIGNMLIPDTEARAVYGSVSSVTHLSQALCTVDAGFRLGVPTNDAPPLE